LLGTGGSRTYITAQAKDKSIFTYKTLEIGICINLRVWYSRRLYLLTGHLKWEPALTYGAGTEE
jgi:hypothetical protein